MKIRGKIALVFLFILTNCVEPYNAVVGYGEDLLVVYASISNMEGPHYVSLSYSSSNISEFNPPPVDAKVKIIDNHGNEVHLNHSVDGIYETPAFFRPVVGNSYTLHIENNSKIYQSAPCLLREPACIDSVYYEAGTNIIDNQERPVLNLKVDASLCSESETFLRWEVEEDWKTELQRPVTMTMTDDNTFHFLDDPYIYCYKNDKITHINTTSLQNLTGSQKTNINVGSLLTDESDRFLLRYRARVFQYSISKEEYVFLSQLKQTSEDVDDFFGRQPYELSGNIKCLTNPDESVLGFFQVAGVSTKDIYINLRDIQRLELPLLYHEICSVDTIFVGEVPSLYELYKEYIASGMWSFYGPLYSFDGKVLLGIRFAQPECAICNSSGANNFPPADWIEDE